MDREDLSDDVKRFVLVSIRSVPYLEAMLLLRNEDGQDWNAAMLARRLYTNDAAAAELLSELHAAGILVAAQAGGYRYQPSSADLRHRVDQLANAYARHLIEISNLIHSKTSQRAQRFADAFKWRKDS